MRSSRSRAFPADTFAIASSGSLNAQKCVSLALLALARSRREPPRLLARLMVTFVASLLFAHSAHADPTATGFAVERFTPSAAGAGWLVMDTLDMHGGLGGAMALTTGYSRNPLQVTDGARSLTPVSDRAFASFAFALTYDRFRLSLNLEAPVEVSGQSGSLDGFTYAAPSLGLAGTPDTLSDARAGFDARLIGGPTSPFRLGASAFLFVPTGKRIDYDSDGTVRSMLRVLVAGDLGRFTYAGNVGVHVRPLDDSPADGSPRGSELMFGGAVGSRFFVDHARRTALVLGPEVWGETSFDGFGASRTTGLEGLMTGRIETEGDGAPNVRVKLGAGGGLDQSFGAPEFRVVVGIEMFGRQAKDASDETLCK